MVLDRWAEKWKISPDALNDLKRQLGIDYTGVERGIGNSEAHIQSLVRLEASRKGARLWRNNVGAATMQDGSFIRYGLANDSKAVNQSIKSADLIGIKPVLITLDMVGWTIGQFLSREIKAEGWKYRGTDREVAQLRWAELILSLGGDSAFCKGEGSI